MSADSYRERLLADEGFAHARQAEWDALVLRAQALHVTARTTRADSRELVARSVEERITREDHRAQR